MEQPVVVERGVKVALEALPGWIGKNPEALVKALASIAAAEGVDPIEFTHSLAKAAGATKAHAHETEASKFLVLRESAETAQKLYATAMTVALSEIVALFEDHLDTLENEDVLRQFGG